MMPRCLVVQLVTAASLLSFAFGIKLMYDPSINTVPGGGQATCGQFKCVESGDITNITVFKHEDCSDGTSFVRLASLNQQEPNLDHITHGIKIIGTLTKKKGEIAMYPLGDDDCHTVTYSCLLIFVDDNGKERESFATLAKPGESLDDLYSSDTSSTDTDAAALTSHVDSLMSSFVTEVSHKQERLEDKMCDIRKTLGSVESKLGTGCTTGDNDDELEEKLQRINDKLEMLEANLNSLNQSLEDHDHQDEVVEDPEPLTNETLGEYAYQSCQRGQPASSNGNYSVINDPLNEPLFLCDTEHDGGGWIVIQRRLAGDQDFYLNWESYKNGFGNLSSDFWLGNDMIHILTNYSTTELYVTMEHQETSYWARYTFFSIEDEQDNYRIQFGTYSGTAVDSLAYHQGMQFSTFDRDNDIAGYSCAVTYKGAWWYRHCYLSHLNGIWGDPSTQGPSWNHRRPLTYTEMKIRYIN